MGPPPNVFLASLDISKSDEDAKPENIPKSITVFMNTLSIF